MLLVRHAVDVTVGVRSTVGALALAVAAANGIACSSPDSPWCDDTASCPAEVLYNDRIYIVECTDHILGFEPVSPTIPAQLRDQQVRVRYHGGDETERRRAWTVHGADPAELIVLDERDTTICDGGTAFAYARPGGSSTLEALLQQSSVASTTTSSASADASRS